MKRALALFLALLMALSLVGCGGKTGDVAEPTEAPAENPYADMESCAEYAIEQLKSVLKNPSSLIVNNLYAVEADKGYIFDIDYSAENGLGGMNRDDLFIAVYSIENGFGVNTYGTGSFSEAENQRYSSQFYTKYEKVAGAYVFDPETLTVLGIDESNVDPYINQRIELKGTMEREKGADTGLGGAWDFELENDPYQKVVYFAEGTDLDWYKNFTGLPYEITISAIKGEDGYYHEAEIVEDTVRAATNEDRLQRFGFYDQRALVITIPDSGIAPMSAEDIQTAFSDATFSMREGEETNDLPTITFHANGTVNAKNSNGQEYSKYDTWKVEDGNILCSHSYSFAGKNDSIDYTITPYLLDETRILLIDATHKEAMILTKQ